MSGRRGPRGLTIALAIALVVALGLAGYAWSTRVSARADRERAVAGRALARHDLRNARDRLRRRESDRDAARAAVVDFANAGQVAVGAAGAVVDAEGALVDRLARLQQAGASGRIDTYNAVVDELRAHDGEINRAADALDGPFENFSRSLGQLPTARCTAPRTDLAQWRDYGTAGLQCTRVAVPLDYAKPHGEQIELTVVRRPADDPQSSHGPLVMNPGGPGISAISELRRSTLDLPGEVLRTFDLVAFDPRGVGQSTPVDCADDLDPLFANALTDADGSVRTAAVRRVEHVAHQCLVRSGDLLRHLDSRTAARDLDRVRAALGVPVISYLGFSYGTYLGALYAEMFPNRLRAAVLDGGVDPNRALGDLSLNHVPDDLDETLRAELDACSADVSCVFHNDGDASAAYDRLMEHLRTDPLAVGPRTLGRGLAELGVVASLYGGTDTEDRLMDALARAALGDGQKLLALSDDYTGRRSDGSYNNELEAHAAIACIEISGRPTPTDAREHVRELGDLDRFEAVDLMLTLPCAFWPIPTITDPPTNLRARRAPATLILANEGDPVTPIEGGRALAKALGRGRLLTWAGSGHTVLARGVDCIDEKVVAYLTDLTLPDTGTVCPA